MFMGNSEMAYASKQIKSSKWLLLLCAAISAAVDLCIIIMLSVGGMGARFLVCPIILLVLDALYFTVSLFFTNFRFKYSLTVWISYAVLFTIVFSVGNTLIFDGNGTVISTAALFFWACVHAFSIVCAIICALTASRIIKTKWIGAVCAVVLLGAGVTYAGFMVDGGFLGQGMNTRALVYTAHGSGADGYYEVTDVLQGKSGKADIPLIFNGKPVLEVNSKIFFKTGISEYSVHRDINFTGAFAGDNLDGKRITVDKEHVNGVRNKLFTLAVSSANINSRANCAALANSALPENLGEGEGYIAFNYGAGALAQCNGEIIPMYIGDLSAFDFAEHTKNYEYVKRRADGSADNYDWAYKNGGYILTEISDANGSVTGGNIEGNTVAEVKFERVFRVFNDGGNDLRFDVREKYPELCFDRVGGQQQNFKYATRSSASTLTEGVKMRKGFGLEWMRYGQSVLLDGKKFTDLSALLGELEQLDAEGDVYISPRWELKAPEVTVKTSAPLNTITYGDSVLISADASIEAEGVSLIYRWSQSVNSGGNHTWSTQNISLDCPKPAEYGGEYKLAVVTLGGTATSLSAPVVNRQVSLNINKKEIELSWKLPENLVYDTENKTVTLEFDETQLVGGDTIGYYIDNASASDNKNYSVRNAGNYAIEAIVTCDQSCYEVSNTWCRFEIEKCPVTVEWGDTELVYNGNVQYPEVTVMGVGGQGRLPITLTGGGAIPATTYTARVSVDNPNYTLRDSIRTYTIKKAPLIVTPAPYSCVYGDSANSTEMKKGLTFEGFVNGHTSAVLLGNVRFDIGRRNAGTYPEGVTVSGFSSAIYDITYNTAELTVSPRVATLSWSGYSNLVYDGTSKNVTATVSNIPTGYSRDVTVVVEGGREKDAGDFTATAEGFAGIDAGNYSLPAGTARERAYTIAKRTVSIKPNDVSIRYGAEAKELTATVTGSIYNDEITYTLQREAGEGAGEYDIDCTLTKNNSNYTVTLQKGIYKIEKRLVHVAWQETPFSYDGTEHTLQCSYDGVIERDKELVSLKNVSATDAGSYTAELYFDISIRGNYEVTNPTKTWQIMQKINGIAAQLDGKVIVSDASGFDRLDLKGFEGSVFSWQYEGEHTVTLTIDGGEAVTVSGTSYTMESAGVYRFDMKGGDKNHSEVRFTAIITVSKVAQGVVSDGQV